MRVVTGYHFCRDNPLFLGFVRKQLSANCVSDCKHVRQIRAHLCIDGDLAALAEIEAECCGIDSIQ
jgi:hypothetical protein